jgi:hypothetical protein
MPGTVIPVTVRGLVDREHGASGLLLGQFTPEMENRELIDEVVQRTPGIVETVTDDESPARIRLSDIPYAKDVGGFLKITIDSESNGVLLTEGSDLSVEYMQVTFGPPYFRPTSFDGN